MSRRRCRRRPEVIHEDVELAKRAPREMNQAVAKRLEAGVSEVVVGKVDGPELRKGVRSQDHAERRHAPVVPRTHAIQRDFVRIEQLRAA